MSTFDDTNAASQHPACYPPIADYGLIGDTRTSALVSREGSIDWFCAPDADSPAVFLRLLDATRGGFFQIRPVDEPTSVTRCYVDNTNILETTFVTPTGSARVFDFCPMGHADGGLGEATRDRGPEIIRIVEGMSGWVRFVLTCRVTPNFARQACNAESVTRDQVTWRWSGGQLWLLAGGLVTDGDTARASFTVEPGQRVVSVIRDAPPETINPIDALHKLAETERYWRTWAERCRYDGPHRSLVVRSALTLKLLTFAPSGAIIAAPTCSLPEEIGGARNWDYRYCWLRDATFTLYALGLLGYDDEARAFMGWIQRVCLACGTNLQIMYGVRGEHSLPEQILDHLDGYRGSRPVRVGNAAYRQLQLDVFGEVLDSAYLFFHKLGGADHAAEPLAGPMWALLRSLVDDVTEHWTEPDSGIWEVRASPKHYVHSKMMCWVALDRGVRLAEAYGLPANVARWRQQRERLRQAILDRGYSSVVGAFTQAFDSPGLDASVLLMPLVGFIAIDDPRMAATITAIQERLTRNGLVYRYLSSDGLPGEEGAFSICTFWLIDCLIFAQRLDEAQILFERMLGYANDLALYSEEIDPRTGAFLGNFPQGFTHVALINAAVNLEKARQRQVAGRVAETPLPSSRASVEPTLERA